MQLDTTNYLQNSTLVNRCQSFYLLFELNHHFRRAIHLSAFDLYCLDVYFWHYRGKNSYKQAVPSQYRCNLLLNRFKIVPPIIALVSIIDEMVFESPELPASIIVREYAFRCISIIISSKLETAKLSETSYVDDLRTLETFFSSIF